MMHEFSLDIVICTYNNASLLRRTLEALANQKVVSPWINWEVLVVNNNCTDETSDVVERFMRSARFPLRMIREARQGLTAARVCGVSNTNGDWIAFVDDDCLLDENWIERAARFAVDHPTCGAFGGRIILEWETSPPAFLLSRRYAYVGKQFGETEHRRPWLAGAGMVLRRTALEASGWVEKQLLEDRIGKRLVSGGDVEIGLRIARSYEIWYTPQCELRHVIPARRLSREYLRGMVFGLGASRHNAKALSWSGSYASWLLYSLVYAVGFALFGLIESVREGIYSGETVDMRLGLGPARGWCAAMLAMMRMDPRERGLMLGAVAATEKSRNQPLASLSMSGN